jgi:hypothetical protein|tara:strand:+ start:704 stop:901 length:198 start_codon:yes stop_codon:yes gene_type:complete
MTAEIVDLLQYRQQKARAEKKSRRAKTGGGRNRATQKEALPREAEAPLPEDTPEGEDGSRGGEPA